MILPDRFWAKVREDRTAGCWIWTAAKSGAGYGRYRHEEQCKYAHRLAYESLVGPIPDGLQLDHLCRVPSCVNPAHLEPVTPAVNTRRGAKAQQTHCKRGHPLSGENLRVYFTGDYTHRVCRTCAAAAMERFKTRTQGPPVARMRAAADLAREKARARAGALKEVAA